MSMGNDQHVETEMNVSEHEGLAQDQREEQTYDEKWKPARESGMNETKKMSSKAIHNLLRINAQKARDEERAFKGEMITEFPTTRRREESRRQLFDGEKNIYLSNSSQFSSSRDSNLRILLQNRTLHLKYQMLSNPSVKLAFSSHLQGGSKLLSVQVLCCTSQSMFQVFWYNERSSCGSDEK
ncbi:hypothetical protein N431DRAFT_442169 [Stipitochalara longipes BDJ]|nr:hypothetical protein N431DRAFT_442169 [Stipitochalara longipes BDJ]